jgi:hypothetical protein
MVECHPSKLEIKPGVPLILLRNIDPGRGLCNGTRLHLIQIRNNVLHVHILTGPCTGEIAFISRIKLISTEGQLPFSLHWIQFPVRLCFAITINKPQGQSLKMVSIAWGLLCLPMDNYMLHSQGEVAGGG